MKPFEFTAPVHTERLVLRKLTLSEHDVDDLHAQQSSPELTAFMLYGPRDRATVIEKIAEWTERELLADTDDYAQLAIVLADAVPPRAINPASNTPTLLPLPDRRDVLIGTLYFKILSADDATAEIGWALHSDFQGSGYAHEAATALLDIAFTEMKLHRVIAKLDPLNEASVRLCRALGMRHEAHHVEDVWLKGEWADTGIYAILEREWAARRA